MFAQFAQIYVYADQSLFTQCLRRFYTEFTQSLRTFTHICFLFAQCSHLRKHCHYFGLFTHVYACLRIKCVNAIRFTQSLRMFTQVYAGYAQGNLLMVQRDVDSGRRGSPGPRTGASRAARRRPEKTAGPSSDRSGGPATTCSETSTVVGAGRPARGQAPPGRRDNG
jgi:hypothetical protein